LQRALRHTKPFRVTMKNIKNFRRTTIYIEPTDGGGMNKVANAIFGTFPQLKVRQHFRGHLTIAQKGSERDAPALQKFFQDNWKEVSFMCSEVCLMKRPNIKDVTRSPFRIYKRFPFGGRVTTSGTLDIEPPYDAWEAPYEEIGSGAAPVAPVAPVKPTKIMARYKITYPGGISIRRTPDPENVLEGKFIPAGKVIGGEVIKNRGFTWLKRNVGGGAGAFTYIPVLSPEGIILAVKTA